MQGKIACEIELMAFYQTLLSLILIMSYSVLNSLFTCAFSPQNSILCPEGDSCPEEEKEAPASVII